MTTGKKGMDALAGLSRINHFYLSSLSPSPIFYVQFSRPVYVGKPVTALVSTPRCPLLPLSLLKW